MVVALMMALASASAGVHPATVIVAPYHHAAQIDSNYVSSSGCIKAKETTKAHWKATTGLGKFAGWAKGASCKGIFGTIGSGSYGSVGGQFEIALSIHIGPGKTSVQAAWTIKAVGAMSLTTSGTCPSPASTSSGYSYVDCYLAAEVGVEADAWVVDLTNGSTFYSTTFFFMYNDTYQQNYTYCYSGTCYSYNYSYGTSPGGFSGTFAYTSYSNGTYNAAHKYALLTYVDAFVYASLSNYAYPGASGPFPTGTASASINMATLGNGATLTSVTIA